MLQAEGRFPKYLTLSIFRSESYMFKKKGSGNIEKEVGSSPQATGIGTRTEMILDRMGGTELANMD